MSTLFRKGCTAQQRLLATIISALLLSACGNNDSESNTAPATHNAAAPVTAQSSNTNAAVETIAAVEVPTPYVDLSLRGLVEQHIEVGEPLFVGVRIEAPDEDSAAMELAPASGGWADAVEVVLLKTGSESPVIQAKLTAPIDATPVSLQGEQVASGQWYFTSAQTRQLTPGEYRVQVRLAIVSGKGWTGNAASQALPLNLVEASAAGASQRALALAHESLFNDKPEDAARLLDAQLENTPDDIGLLTLRATVSARAGNYAAAMLCVNRALQQVEIDKWNQPPIDLHILENQLIAAMSGTSADQPELPAWSEAPKVVLDRLQQVWRENSDAAEAETALEPIVPDAASDTTPVVDTTTATTAVTASSTTPPDKAPTPAAAASGTHIGSVIAPAELNEAKILADPNGQWASGARAGTEYGTDTYGAMQMIGAPNVPGVGGDNGSAWAHSSASIALEWIELDYAKPVHATEVRIRQTNVPGTIVKVEAIEPNGSAHTWWEGVDPYIPTDDIDLAWFAVRVPATSYLVAKVKVTLNMAAIPGWKEIDAVQLVGNAE